MPDSSVLELPISTPCLADSLPPEDPAPSRPKAQNVLLAVHVSRDEHTAVYRHTCDLAAYLEEQGHSCAILTTDDFPWINRISPRLTPILFPLAVAYYLARAACAFDTAIFHSHAGWA